MAIKFIKLTNAQTHKPIWVNPFYILDMAWVSDQDRTGITQGTDNNGDFTLYVDEHPEHIINLIDALN
jgi:hypothetical protein